MRRFGNAFALVSLVAAGLALAGCQKLLGGDPQAHAEKRVDLVFAAVQKWGDATSQEYQTAVCTWYEDKIVIKDLGEFGWAYDKFGDFKREAGLAKGMRYEIEGSREVEGKLGAEWIVYGTVNGERFEVVVPDGAAIRWKIAPPYYG